VGKRKPYEGGAWAIGGVLSKAAARPARPSLRWLLARQAQIREYMAHVEATGGWLAADILAYYRAELSELNAMIAQKRARTRQAQAHERIPAKAGN